MIGTKIYTSSNIYLVFKWLLYNKFKKIENRFSHSLKEKRREFQTVNKLNTNLIWMKWNLLPYLEHSEQNGPRNQATKKKYKQWVN